MNVEASRILGELGASIRPTARVANLSVADCQLIELASALSHEAKVLILDETTASLTPKEVAELFAIVRRLQSQGRAIMFVSHHLDEVFEIAGRITVLRDGEVVGRLDPRIHGVEDAVRLMVGRAVSFDRTPSAARAEVVLEIERLSVPRRVFEADLKVKAGEIVGLGGLVGAGRTDLCRGVFGLSAAKGSVKLKGQDYRRRSPAKSIARGLAMVSEDRQHEGLLLPMTLSENATMVVGRRLSNIGFLDRRTERRETAKILAEMSTAYRDTEQAASQLSGGNQQKVVLSKWLMAKPEVLILDEPTRGVDVGAKEEVHRLIRDLARQGMGILMVSSDLPELLALSDRVLVMREGRIVAEIDGNQATPEAVMTAAAGQVEA
jgi:ABC-type sugar transport system ATPase subunit